MPPQGGMRSEKPPCSGQGPSASPNPWQPASLGLAHRLSDSLSCPSGHNKDFLHPSPVSLPPCPKLGRPRGRGRLSGSSGRAKGGAEMCRRGERGWCWAREDAGRSSRGEKAFWWGLQELGKGQRAESRTERCGAAAESPAKGHRGDCAGLDWDGVNVVASSWHGALFWICAEHSVDKPGRFSLLLSCAYPVKAFSLLTLPRQRGGWGCPRSWEGTQPGQRTPADQRDGPHHGT